MLTERDFVTNEWVGCGGLHMVPLVQRLVADELPLRILDMGCGCGAIGISLLHQWLVGGLVMTDVDEQSVDFARRNSARILPDAGVACYVADVFVDQHGEPLELEPFDLIVCNAPLSATPDLANVPATWNPLRVLSFGNDFQRRLFTGLDRYLSVGGIIIIKDLVANSWHTSFQVMRLERVLVGDQRTLQQSTSFTDVQAEPALPGQHCLRMFRRVE